MTTIFIIRLIFIMHKVVIYAEPVCLRKSRWHKLKIRKLRNLTHQFVIIKFRALPCSFYLLSSFFIPRLISAAADRMSTILPHMVWPYRAYSANLECIAGLKCAARGSLEIQDAKNDAKKSPSAHHHTTLSGYIFATKARIDNRKKTC